MARAGHEAWQTRRQEIAELLVERERDFDELRRELAVPVHLLEDDLKHLARSLRRGPRRLLITPATCEACGFVFEGREPHRFHTPGRCPRCRSPRIEATRLRVAER